MELNLKQKEIVETKEKEVLVCCVAASGKTRVLTERVKYLVDSGVSPSKIVVITFTNAAADEMRKRIGDKGERIFIGTIHSYANFLLRCQSINTNHIIKDEAFDEFLPLITENPHCLQEVEHLLLDEAQDTDEDQFHFLINQIKPHNYFLVGDPRQTIYAWRGVNPNALFELKETSSVVTYELNDNYRNGKKIMEFAKSIINKLGWSYRDVSVCANDKIGQVTQTIYDPATVIRFIKNPNYGSYGSWFVLARTNDMVDEIVYHLKKAKIPTDTFKKGDLTSDELNNRLSQDSVKVLTIHTAKGLEADNVIVIDARAYNAEEIRISYVAATRAKNHLIWMSKRKARKKYQSWE